MNKPIYQVKNSASGTFQDIETQFSGVRILKMDGFLELGKPVNIYTAQWVNEQAEDFLITTVNQSNQPVVVRENVDISITFIVGNRYSSSLNFDAQATHDTFVKYMTDSDVWIQSGYMGNKYVHCVCLSAYKPTTVKLGRGNDSYILGTLTLHTLDAPQTSS